MPQNDFRSDYKNAMNSISADYDKIFRGVHNAVRNAEVSRNAEISPAAYYPKKTPVWRKIAAVSGAAACIALICVLAVSILRERPVSVSGDVYENNAAPSSSKYDNIAADDPLTGIMSSPELAAPGGNDVSLDIPEPPTYEGTPADEIVTDGEFIRVNGETWRKTETVIVGRDLFLNSGSFAPQDARRYYDKENGIVWEFFTDGKTAYLFGSHDAERGFVFEKCE